MLQVQLRPSSVFFAIEESEDLADVQFTLIADIPIISPVLCLRAMDPSQALLLLSLPSSFHLLNWATGQRINVQMLAEEEEELVRPEAELRNTLAYVLSLSVERLRRRNLPHIPAHSRPESAFHRDLHAS